MFILLQLTEENTLQFISNLSKSKADVIGINDYCTLKGYEEVIKLESVPGKIIFPVIEFRMHNIVANRKNVDPTKSGVKINFHVIFDNDSSIFKSITTWVNSLDCYDDKGKIIQLGTADDLSKVSVDFKNVVESLNKLDLMYKSHSQYNKFSRDKSYGISD